MNKSLKTTIRLNALSCLGFGIAFALLPNSIGAFLDGIPPLIMRIVGIGLAINGLHLVTSSFRHQIGRFELAYFILGDFLWVLASLILITVVPQIIHSTQAIISTLAVAIIVGSLAMMQTKYGWNILKPAP